MSRPRAWHGVTAPAPPAQYRRLAVLTVLLMAGLVGMVVQLVRLQVWQAEALRDRAERIRSSKEYFTPRRGRIADRDGVTLAHSFLVKTVGADPRQVGPRYARFLAGKLAEPLGMEMEELTALLAQTTRSNQVDGVQPVKYVRLKRGVSQESWEKVREILRGLDLGQDDHRLSKQERVFRTALKRKFTGAISAELVDEQVRAYPRGRLAAHVLGFVGHNPRWEQRLDFSSTTGAEGIELSLNSVLEGIPGWRIKRRALRGSKELFEYEEDFRARPGLDVILALDVTLQQSVENALVRASVQHRPRSATGVVVNPRTGEILAMASLPSFDPNEYGKSSFSERRNRAVADAYQPGSTFKAISFGVGLHEGVVSMDASIDCGNGIYYYGPAYVRDPMGYGRVPLHTALAKSSNIAAAKIGVDLGAVRLYQGILRFGIGQPTGIPLPGEAAGILRPPEEWTRYHSPTHVPYGYELTATPLQMTMAVAAIANGGRLMRPLLVKRIEDGDGQVVTRFASQVRMQAISEKAAADLTRGLRAVVEEGTGRQAAFEGYSAAGKTGTAVLNENGSWDGGYFSSFIGFFPAEDPRVCIGVFLDNPQEGSHSGGGSAAPVFREIAREAAVYLGIPPSVEPANLAARLPGLGEGNGRGAGSRM